MKVIILVGYGTLILTCLVVGVRLLRLALRTRQLPECALGLCLLSTGGLGYPLLFIRSLAFVPDGIKGEIFAAGLVGLNVGSLALYLFNWRVFRSGSLWAALVFAGALLVLVVSFLVEVLTTGFEGERSVVWYAVGTVTRALPYAWAAAESLRHYARLRRSLSYGLADPIVVDRFRLWAVASAAIFANYAIIFVSGLVGELTTHPPELVALVAGLGIPAAIAMSLAFNPPAFYRRRFAEPQPTQARNVPA